MSFDFLLLNLFLIFTSQFGGGPCGCEDKPQINTLAVVNGVKITKQELGSEAQNKITLLQNEVIKARNAELALQINNFLLETEARRRGLSYAQLLQVEVVARVPEPTEAEAEAFYKQRKEQMPESFKVMKAKIIALLRAERELLAVTQLLNTLRPKANVNVVVPDVTPPANEEDLNRVFARVNGRSITSRDIEESLLPLIFSVQEQVYATRREDLDLRINDLLLEQEAKRQNLPPTTVLARAIRARLPIITDQQAKVFYDQNKASLGGDFEKVKFQVIQYLTQREQDKLSKEFAAQLRQEAAVQIYLTPPESPIFKITTDDQPTLGNLNAAVTVVQFSDFESTACARQHPEFKRLVAEFGAQVKFVVRDYPLAEHQNAMRAAKAAEAAREQGKYWEYVSLLYANQSALQVDNLKQYAAQLGLDRTRFVAAMNSGKINDQVQRDVEDGSKLRLSSTPVFFVNGKRVTDYSYDGLKATIKAALTRLR